MTRYWKNSGSIYDSDTIVKSFVIIIGLKLKIGVFPSENKKVNEGWQDILEIYNLSSLKIGIDNNWHNTNDVIKNGCQSREKYDVQEQTTKILLKNYVQIFKQPIKTSIYLGGSLKPLVLLTR